MSNNKIRWQSVGPISKFKEFRVLDIDGEEYEVLPGDINCCRVLQKEELRYKLLKRFIKNELVGKEDIGQEPVHIKYMRQLELLDYCPESDIGHFKWYPNGLLIVDLLKDYAFYNIAKPMGAFKMQNPLIYREDIESIKKLQGEFHERDYRLIVDGKPMVLRFASDPGAFPFMQKVLFSYKQMPIKIYEEATCFRKEQSGEVVGLFRLRCFQMTDMHVFCLNEEQAKEEYIKLSKLFAKLMNEIAGKYWILAWEVVKDFYEKYKEDIFIRLVKELKIPAFIKIMDKMSHYFAFKSEYQFITKSGHNIQVATVQWDIKNGKRFEITYVDKDGNKKPVPIILHASSIGSVERALACLLEKVEYENRKPMLPLWLAPEQVRILPISEKYLQFSEEIANKMEENDIRVGIDDRDIPLSKKVRDAEKKWIPYIVIIGEKEVNSEKLSIIRREDSKKIEMKLEELIEEIKDKTKGKPFRPLYIQRRFSERVIFVSS